MGTTVEELKAKQVADKQELSNTIETVRVGLVAEDDVIKASVTELGKKVDANYAEMVATDTAIRSEITNLDTKIQGDIATAKTEINATISALESKHNTDIQALDDKIFENDVLTKEALLNKADKNHTHTKADVGLGKVENYAVATTEEAIAGVVTDKYMTPALVAEALRWGGATTFANTSVELRQVVVSSYTDTENQKVLTIPYEYFDKELYLLELRVGGVPFFHERYTIDGKTITLKEGEVGFALGKRVDFVITFLEQVGDNKLPVHGRNLYNGSVTLEKLSPEVQEKLGGVIEGGGSTGSGSGMTEEEKQAIYTALDAKAEKEHIHSAYEIAINKKAEKVHTHADLELAISGKAEADHVHAKYENIADGKADVNHTHPDLQTAIDGKADSVHTHSDLELAIAGKSDTTHTHADLEAKIAEKANAVHTHTEYASTTHASTHGYGGSDAIQVVEEMLSDELKRKINYPSGDVGFPELDGLITDVTKLKADITGKADAVHTHADLSEQISANTASIASTNETVATKADKTYVDTEITSVGVNVEKAVETAKTELTEKINGKADSVHTHADLATKSEVDAKHAQYDLAMGLMNENIESKASASHTHTASQISGLPTSLPANGGNSSTVGGVGVAGLARYYQSNGSVNIADTNIKQFYGTCVTQNSSAPSTDWWHIINVPHQDSNGYGAQLALGYHGNAGLHVRSASGTSWGNWYDVIGNIELAKTMGGSSPCVCILSNAYASLDLALASSTSAEKVANAEIDYQVGGWTASGGSVIVPTAGTYLLTLVGGLEVKSGSVNTSNGLNVEASILKNGSSLGRISPIFSNISSSGYGNKWHGLMGTCRYGNTSIISLGAGDTLTFRGNLGSYVNNTPLTVGVRLTIHATLQKL